MMIITFSDITNDGMMIDTVDRTRVFLRLAAKKALYIYIYIGSQGCQGPRDDGWGGVPAEAACLTFNTDHSSTAASASTN